MWEEANRRLADLSTRTILERFDVRLIGTTDSPEDDLSDHRRIRAKNVLPNTAVYPAFRPDKAHQLADLEAWNAAVDAIGAAAEVSVHRFDDFQDALTKRHAFFHDRGARLSDHGMPHLPDAEPSEARAALVFEKARSGGEPSPADRDVFSATLLRRFGRLDHDAGWTHQLHLGALRNNNAWAYENLGPDTGFDSIGDERQAPGLRRHLGGLAGEQKLPQTILYNLNPDNNELFATMAGNFQSAPTPGKVQFGSGWWFLDQKDGMTRQLNALSNCGLLAHFVGMTTDSRSMLSFPRHEYFRRVLCDLLGREMEAGELPDDLGLVGGLVKDLCFDNAQRYFGMALPHES